MSGKCGTAKRNARTAAGGMRPEAIHVRDACRRYVTAKAAPGLLDPVCREEIFKKYGQEVMLCLVGSERRNRANDRRNPRPYRTPVRVIKELLGDCEVAIARLVGAGEARRVGFRYESPRRGHQTYLILLEDDLPDYFKLKPRRSVAVF